MHRYILVSILAAAVFGQQYVLSSKGMRIVISNGENLEQYFQDTEGETQSISLLGLMGAQEGSKSSEMGNVTSRHLQSSGSLDWKYLIKETLLYIFVQYSTDGYGRYILTRCHGCSGVASKLQILEGLDPDNHPAEKSGDFYFVGQKWYYVTMDVSVKYTYIFGVIACVDPDLTYCYQNGELSYKSISFTPSFSPYILGSLIGVLLVSLS